MNKTCMLVLIAISASLLFLHPLRAQTTRKVTRINSTGIRRDSKIKAEASKKVLLPFISDLRVVPSASNAIISFKSSQRRLPLVEIGKEPPKPDRFGIIAFPLGTSLFSRFVQLQDGRYTLNFNATNEQLEAGTVYYYIINVFNDNENDPSRKREQETGVISTFTQSVKVVWEKIFIVNDSDDGGAGEISLWFWINYGQPGSKYMTINRLGNNSASTGQTFEINIEHIIDNAPNELSLSVSGSEDDLSIFGGMFGSGDLPSPPLTGPSRSTNFEHNVASEIFDLARFPSEVGETRSQQFKLVSMPNGGNLGNLSFEIHGRFEITRRVQ